MFYPDKEIGLDQNWPFLGEFINRNNIETYHMAAYMEFPMTKACEILLYFLITFCAYMTKTQSLSSTTVSDIATTSSVQRKFWL